MNMDSAALNEFEAFPPPPEMETRRRSVASLPTGHTTPVVVPPIRSFTPLSASRFPPPPLPPAERLAQRLRSNSGVAFQGNQAALDQYINYQNSGYARPPSSTSASHHGALYEEDAADLTETCSESSRGDGGLSGNVGRQPRTAFIDFLGRGAFQMSLDNPSISRQLLKYCGDHGCEENIEFLMKVCRALEFGKSLMSSTILEETLAHTPRPPRRRCKSTTALQTTWPPC